MSARKSTKWQLNENTFGVRLREFREAKQYGLKRLAKKAGLSAHLIMLFENGIEVPTWDVVELLAAALNKKTDAFREIKRVEEEPDTQCQKCGRLYKYNQYRGHKKTLCNTCFNYRNREGFKEKLLAAFGGKCLGCGYSRCQQALVFHHRPGETKLFRLGGACMRSWETCLKEARKCDLLCANCHAEVHAGMLQIARPGEIKPAKSSADTEQP